MGPNVPRMSIICSWSWSLTIFNISSLFWRNSKMIHWRTSVSIIYWNIAAMCNSNNTVMFELDRKKVKTITNFICLQSFTTLAGTTFQIRQILRWWLKLQLWLLVTRTDCRGRPGAMHLKRNRWLSMLPLSVAMRLGTHFGALGLLQMPFATSMLSKVVITLNYRCID